MTLEQHKENILRAIKNKNIFELRKLSRKGFIDNELRKKVWPILLGCDEFDNNEYLINNDHNYYEQIKKDTIRSMHHFDITKCYSINRRQREQETLERILNGIFGKNLDLHYTQGFHDMCSVFYIVCGENLGLKLSENLAKRHMRDLVRDNMNVYQFILKLLFPLLSLIDNELYNKLVIESKVSSIFALSWLLTWFAHNIETFNDITRLYDFFLSTHPLMPLYFTCSILMDENYVRSKLLNINNLDQGKLHEFFQKYDWNDINFDLLIIKSDKIFNKYPPHDLYREYFIDELKNVPKDSPFLAKNINEIDCNLKSFYSGYNLTSIWNYQNPKFWRYLAIPLLTAVVGFYVVSSATKS